LVTLDAVTTPAPIAIGLMARAPVPGRCKKALAAVLGAAGAARLYAAMLRDTLEARARIPAKRHLVFVAPEDGGAAAVRALVPSPWEVVEQSGTMTADRMAHAMNVLRDQGGAVALMEGDAPTVPVARLIKAFHGFTGGRRALMGPCEDGGLYLLALTEPDLAFVREAPATPKAFADATRVRSRELGVALVELAMGYDVKEPLALERLRVELAGHPERAPRTAQFLRDNPP
jgi:glycosyltransferase A (GT-A) superfamily protein (DUF2064 family)